MNSPHSDPADVPPEADSVDDLPMDPPPFCRVGTHPELERTYLENRGSTSQFSTSQKQLNFLFERSVLKNQIADRILHIDNKNEDGRKLLECHSTRYRAKCNGCAKTKMFWSRCELRFCPLCAKRLARERQQQLRFWMAKLRHPKMITLTARNVADLNNDCLDNFKNCWRKLRRSKLFEGITGGFWSLEITNQGRGWHVHIHALVEGAYIPQDKLAGKWAKLIRQDIAIVDIRAAKDIDVVKEICKYMCKPTEMAHWPDEQLITYLEVVKSTKLFGVFGSLHGLRGDYTEMLKLLRYELTQCECGCNDWTVDTVFEDPVPVEWRVRLGPQMQLLPQWEAHQQVCDAIAN